MRAIAFYLPQYHPIPENDRWWGKGFTEWTNVKRAKPLFKDHRQPRVPGELGYYDLLDPDVREKQACLARDAGLAGFCYWHYWFAGDRLLERPFDEVLETGKPDFPFCLGWANESWSGVWHGEPDRTLIEQTYPGADDEERHFRALEPAFHDPRYLRVEGKPIFYVYKPMQIPDSRRFTDHWRELAIKSGLNGIHFVGEDVFIDTEPWDYQADGFDAVAPNSPGVVFLRLARRRFWPRYLLPRLVHKYRNYPLLNTYNDYVSLATIEARHDDFYPSVLPNWDNTPRIGRRGYVLAGSTPDLFRRQLWNAIVQVRHRDPDRQIVFIKSWNEWAEGNYLEPDRQHGTAYLDACREILIG